MKSQVLTMQSCLGLVFRGRVLLGLGLVLLPSVAHASGSADGIALSFGLAALPVVLVLLLVQGLSLWLAKSLMFRKVVGGLTLLLSLISLGWFLLMMVAEISVSHSDFFPFLWDTAFILIPTVCLHLLSLGLGVGLFLHKPAQGAT